MAFSDADLWARSRAGDAEAFGLLFERYARPIYNFCYRRIGNQATAQELLSIVFLEAWRRRNKSLPADKVLPWLYGIATNIVRDSARRAKYRDDVPLQDESEGSSDVPVSTTPQPAHQAEIRTDLQRALQQLEPVQREMLWLAYAQGASHEEIADILGLRAISIRTLLLRARKKAARFLTGEVKP